MPPIAWILFTLAAYLFGSIPFGYLVGHLRGIDIRDHGSGNIGATNVLRTLGKPLGIITFIFDVLKGFAPVFLATALEFPDGLRITLAIAAILGHNFPVWLKFKGGKGIATSAGAVLPLIPIPLAIGFIVWIAAFFWKKYVSLASLAAAASIPLSYAILSGASGTLSLPLLLFTLALCALAFWRHRANITRLRTGTENRFTRKKSADES